MSGIQIRDNGVIGIEIDVPYTTDLGSDNQIHVTVSDFGINVAGTSDLNADGYQALKQALAIAEAIQVRGWSNERL